MGSKLAHLLPQRPSLFVLNYSRGYETFIIHRVVADTTHTLSPVRARILQAREKTGLWWHVTVGPNSTKARVVRSWVRRRLKIAFAESLKERGIAEDGKILRAVAETRRPHIIDEALKKGQELSLTGSVKMHALPPLVTAKFALVKEETGALVNALLRLLEADLKMAASGQQQRFPEAVIRTGSVPQRSRRVKQSYGSQRKQLRFG